MNPRPIDTRIFGNTRQKVTLTELGGEGVLRTQGRIPEAREVIQEAIARGVIESEASGL